jgi:hypothetical protein
MTRPGSILALRGALVGLVAAATAYAVFRSVSAEVDRKPDISGVEALGVIVLYSVGLGVVAAVTSGWWAAWLLRLPRPWLFALAGLLPGLTAACRAGWLVVVITPPVYAAVAVALGRAGTADPRIHH